MTLRKLRSFLSGTLRGRLILSVAAIHAVMMTLFILDLTGRQRTMLLDVQTQEAVAMSQSLATSTAEWIAANDVAGLQEIVEAESSYPETLFVILTDKDGHILASTDKNRIGLYLLDLPRDIQQTTISRSATLVDVVAPAMLGNMHVGWVRVGVGQEAALESITRITIIGILYALGAIMIGSFIAWRMGLLITRRLYAVQDTISEVKRGVHTARSDITGTDEAASIAREFNSMLDTLDERNQEILRSEIKYRLLLQNIHAAVVVYGADTSILMSNPVAQELLELTEDQLLGKMAFDPSWHFLREDGTVMSVEEYPANRVFATYQPQRNFVMGVHRPDKNSNVWVLVNADPILDKQDKIAQVIVTFIDITDRKRATEEIQDLYDHAPCGYHSLNDQSLIVRMNDTELQWLGYTREEIVGKIRFTDLISAPSLQIFKDNFPLFKELGQIRDLEFELIRKDGTLLPVLVSSTAIYDDAGNFLMSRSTLYDITERRKAEEALRKSEEELRAFFSQSIDGCFYMMLDAPVRWDETVDKEQALDYIFAHQRITQINDAMLAQYGATREQMLSLTPNDFFEHNLEHGRDIWRRFFDTGKLRIESDERKMDGTPIWVEGEYIAFHDPQGRILGHFGIQRDITERKQAEEALREREKHSQSLLRLSQKLEQAQTYTDVLNAARDEVKNIIGYQNLWAYLLTEDKKYFKSLVAGGPMAETVMSEDGTATLSIEGDRMLEEIAKAKGIVIVEDAQKDERTNKEMVARLENHTLVNVPIILFDRHLGSIGMGTFGSEGVLVPTESEQGYLSALASHLAVSFDRIHLLGERRRAEKALKIAGAYNRSLIEASLDPLVTISPEGKITDVNQSTEAITGIPREQLIGDDFSNYFIEPEKAQKGYQTVLSEGLVRDYPLTIRHISGKTTDVLYNATVYKNEVGEMQGVFAAARDISERKRAEEELRVSEEKFRAIIEQSSEGVALIDETGLIVEWNQTNEKMTGLERSKMIGLPLWDMMMMTVAPERKTAQHFETFKKTVQEALKTGQSYLFTKPVEAEFYPHASGEKHFLHQTIFPIKTEKGYRIASLTHDITERKLAEQKIKQLAAIVESSDDAITSKTLDGITLSWNKGAEKIYGYTESEMVGGKISILIPPGQEDEEPQILKRIASGEYIEHYETIRRRKDGQDIFMSLAISPIRDSDGRIVAASTIAHDITTRKQAEEALRKTNVLLERIFSTTEFMITYLDAEFNFIRVNRTYAEADDHTPEFFVGKNHFALYPNAENEAIFQKVVDTGEAYSTYAKPFIYPEHPERGTTYWNWTLQPIKGADGRVYELVYSLVNVTEREKAVIAQHESDERYRTLVEQASDGIFIADPQGNYIDVNPSGCNMLGYTREEILKLSMKELASAESQKNKPLQFDVLQSGKSITTERMLVAKSGALLPVEISGKALDNGDFIGIVRDITERKRADEALRKSEQKYRALTENIPNVVYQCKNDARYSFLYLNDAVEELTGYPKEDFLDHDLSFFDLYHPDDVANILTPEEDQQSAINQKAFHVTYRIHNRSGEWRWVDEWGTGITNANGEVDYLEGIMVDITERKHHEREREAIISVSTALRQAATRTEILNVILDQLVNLFEVDGAMLVLPNSQNGDFINEMGRGTIGEKMEGVVIPPGEGVCNWVIKHKKPYLNNRADQDPLFYRPDLLGDSHCVACAPLIAQELSVGAVWAARQMDFTEQDLRLLNAIADIAANAIHRIILHEQTEQQLNHLIALHQIDIAISSNFDSNLTLDVILNNVKNELEVNAADILLFNPVTHTLDYAAGLGFRTRAIEQSHVKLADGHAGAAAREYHTVSCPDLNLARESFGRSTLLADEQFVAHYATPLIVKGQIKGVLELFHRKAFTPESDWIDYFETLATQAAIAIESASLLENLQRSNAELMLAYDATIEGWSRALDLRDRETEGHTQRVTTMALELAEKMGISDAEKQHIWRGSLLHDIGKMGIPDSILLKPGPLSESEWDVMRQHPFYAYKMLSPITYLKRALEISYCHHEKWDGSGYPRGLKGEEIPLAARLFAVVDVFDALTSDRPYRKAWTREDVYRYIQEQAGKHFDPQVVKIFLENKRDERSKEKINKG